MSDTTGLLERFSQTLERLSECDGNEAHLSQTAPYGSPEKQWAADRLEAAKQALIELALEDWPAISAALRSYETQAEVIAGLREALEPSDETKAAYMSEVYCDHCDEDQAPHFVPWGSIKSIMKMIRARALSHGEKTDG